MKYNIIVKHKIYDGRGIGYDIAREKASAVVMTSAMVATVRILTVLFYPVELLLLFGSPCMVEYAVRRRWIGRDHGVLVSGEAIV
ncbi:hypothetical protein PSENEW3n2_00000870 [Picochlorum sp. SENEW3]|nr:hypothetical protein PSENEW3n2_00000870 [Picochlorum sp. SENEW3]WPT15792.1 hypothetical protein PSENEW3_00000870 [Picochlorum sp. SENEW3]